jgi:hypothetical protein
MENNIFEPVIEEKHNLFDNRWWDDFLDTTKGMTQTAVFKNCLSAEETAEMRGYILDILAELARRRTTKYGYRVYVDDVLLESNDMIPVYDTPPLPGEALEDWVKRAFGDRKFGMIINQGERFSLKLSKKIALKIAPLLEKTGVPTEGIIFTLFIGNYDNTPLGIHKDLPGKSVIHFHLGPGGKTMYTWDTKKYLSLVGEEKHNNKAVDKYIPYANEHPFIEGDLYFMPENIYHVGRQEGLSIAIACWCYNRSNYQFATRIQELFSEQYLANSNIMLKPDRNELENTDGLNKTLALFNIPEHLKDLSFEQVMRETYKDLRYSLHSNAGYRTSPFPNSDPKLFSLTDTIQIEEPYKILYKNFNGKLFVYLRGIKVEMTHFACIETFIDKINAGAPVRVEHLLEILDKDWPEESKLYLLTLLHKHHTIRLAD